MDYAQTVLFQIAAGSAEAASQPGGLLAELEGHTAGLSSRPGFAGSRITRTTMAEGNVQVLAETRWRDESSLAAYESAEPNVQGIVREHDASVVSGSVQVLRSEAGGGEAPAGELSVTDRLVLPLMIPLGVFLFGVLVVYGLSRIYLEIPATSATGLALGVSIAILLTAWYLSTSSRVPRYQVAGIAVLAAGLLLGGGIYAGVHDEDETEGAVESPTPAASPSPGPGPGPGPGGEFVLEIAAVPTIQFDTDELRAPSGTEVTVRFDNQDTGIPHNVAFYTDDSASEDIAGRNENICTAPCMGEVTFEPLDEGQYFFRCDVHPQQMTGALVIEGGPPGGGPGPGGSVESPTAAASPSPGPGPGPGPGEAFALDIAAVPTIQFDTDELRAPSGTEITARMDNQDTGIPHNIAFYTDDSASEDIAGKNENICTAPCMGEVTFGPLDEGQYFFRCDVHPQQMTGTLVIEGGPAGGAAP